MRFRSATMVARQLGAVIVDAAMRHREHGVENRRAELVADALLERGARVILAHTVLDDIVQNAGDDRVFVSAVPRENDRYVRRMRQIRKTRPFADLSVVMLRGKGERMVDSIRIPVDRHR